MCGTLFYIPHKRQFFYVSNDSLLVFTKVTRGYLYPKFKIFELRFKINYNVIHNIQYGYFYYFISITRYCIVESTPEPDSFCILII